MGLAAVVLAVLIAQIAVAGGSDDGRIASLQRQVKQLEAQVSAKRKGKKKSRHVPRGPAGAQGPAGPVGSGAGCKGDDDADSMVAAGSVCIDRYEASVWSSPTGGTQYGTTSDDYPCSDSGQDCTGAKAIYARSVPGTSPSAHITWPQAQQALANVGKRLPTNAEWQQAVAGTPDDTGPATTPCNTRLGSVQNTGANPGCISSWGANDMVGNLAEWVADWVPASTSCPGWGTFSDDAMCLSGASDTQLGPGVLVRGGDFQGGASAGPFDILGGPNPYGSGNTFGFRGAR